MNEDDGNIVNDGGNEDNVNANSGNEDESSQ